MSCDSQGLSDDDLLSLDVDYYEHPQDSRQWEVGREGMVGGEVGEDTLLVWSTIEREVQYMYNVHVCKCIIHMYITCMYMYIYYIYSTVYVFVLYIHTYIKSKMKCAVPKEKGPNPGQLFRILALISGVHVRICYIIHYTHDQCTYCTTCTYTICVLSTLQRDYVLRNVSYYYAPVEDTPFSLVVVTSAAPSMAAMPSSGIPTPSLDTEHLNSSHLSSWNVSR